MPVERNRRAHLGIHHIIRFKVQILKAKKLLIAMHKAKVKDNLVQMAANKEVKEILLMKTMRIHYINLFKGIGLKIFSF